MIEGDGPRAKNQYQITILAINTETNVMRDLG